MGSGLKVEAGTPGTLSKNMVLYDQVPRAHP